MITDICELLTHVYNIPHLPFKVWHHSSSTFYVSGLTQFATVLQNEGTVNRIQMSIIISCCTITLHKNLLIPKQKSFPLKSADLTQKILHNVTIPSFTTAEISPKGRHPSSVECIFQRGIKNVGQEHSWRRPKSVYHISLGVLLLSQWRELVYNVHMVISLMWRGLGNMHGFVLDGQTYQQDGLLLSTNWVRFSCMRSTTLGLCMTLFLSNWARGAMPKQQQ